MNQLEPDAPLESKQPEIWYAGPRQIDDVLLLVSEFHQMSNLPFSASSTVHALHQLLANETLGFILISRQATVTTGYGLISFGYSLEFGGRDAFVDELYVRPAYQRQGIGTALLVEAEKLATLLGVNALHLESDFDNPHATSLYESKAYQRHMRFLMTKWLNPASDLRA